MVQPNLYPIPPSGSSPLEGGTTKESTTSPEARKENVQYDTATQATSPSVPPSVTELSFALAKSMPVGSPEHPVSRSKDKVDHRRLTADELVQAGSESVRDLVAKYPELKGTYHPVITTKGLITGDGAVSTAIICSKDPNSLGIRRDTRVALFRGCTGEQLYKIATNRANPDVGRPSEQAAVNQTSELALALHVPEEERLVEFSSDISIAEGFGTGQFVVVVLIDAKYLTKGSGVEHGWVADPSAPCEILGWKECRDSLGSSEKQEGDNRAAVLAQKAREEAAKKEFQGSEGLLSGQKEEARVPKLKPSGERKTAKATPPRTFRPSKDQESAEDSVHNNPSSTLRTSEEMPSGRKVVGDEKRPFHTHRSSGEMTSGQKIDPKPSQLQPPTAP